ncbi:uncharacterized protein BJX67DRAFT_120854 [Aspergillus lucknowensis]|uniref:Uncharacterized protein n=1 Tax=Aspergillus lucknowensis TaxID=176173 RepID=A0ABR4LR65_9EURO
MHSSREEEPSLDWTSFVLQYIRTPSILTNPRLQAFSHNISNHLDLCSPRLSNRWCANSSPAKVWPLVSASSSSPSCSYRRWWCSSPSLLSFSSSIRSFESLHSPFGYVATLTASLTVLTCWSFVTIIRFPGGPYCTIVYNDYDFNAQP